MKDIELPPLPAPFMELHQDLGTTVYDAWAAQMQAFARAAVEADRAQRVPEIDYEALIHAGWTKHKYAQGTRGCVAFKHGAEWFRSVLLASTPAPAQQEPVNAVAYLDIGAGGYMDLGTDMSDEALSLLPKGRHMLVIAGTYGVDGYTAAKHQEPPKQERKPMTHIKEQARSYQVAQLAPTTGMVAISSAAYIELYERHHGIKE